MNLFLNLEIEREFEWEEGRLITKIFVNDINLIKIYRIVICFYNFK